MSEVPLYPEAGPSVSEAGPAVPKWAYRASSLLSIPGGSVCYRGRIICPEAGLSRIIPPIYPEAGPFVTQEASSVPKRAYRGSSPTRKCPPP